VRPPERAAVAGGLGGRPALRALAGTVLGNLPGFALPFLITARIEAGRLTDAYFYAFAIAIFGTAIVALTLENNVVPVAAHHARSGPARFRAFVRGLVVRSVAWSPPRRACSCATTGRPPRPGCASS